MEAGLGERASTDFPSVRLGPVSLFCCCDFRGSKTLWFGFYLLLFPPCLAFLSSKGCPGCERSLQQKRLRKGGGKPRSNRSICSSLT